MGLAHGPAGALALSLHRHSGQEWRYAWRMPTDEACPLCSSPGGELLWEGSLCRVVRVTDDDGKAFPGSCRVILTRHVAEMSELPATDAHRLMDVVLATERALRKALRPDKVNLASLGNLVPHLHWHVVPRWRDDSHFPAPIWAARRREAAPHTIDSGADLGRAIESELSKTTDTP